MKRSTRPVAMTAASLGLASVLALSPSLAATAAPSTLALSVKPAAGGGGTLPGEGYDPGSAYPGGVVLPNRVSLEVFKILLLLNGPVIYLWTEAMLEDEARRLGLIR